MRPELAADDWGFSKGINEGILNLARAGLVRVVSMIANAPYLHHGLAELKKVEGVKFALHLNFTAGTPLETVADNSSLVRRPGNDFHPFKAFMWNWMSGKIDPSELVRESRAQGRLLRELVGNLAEADGHHHVHLVPGVVRALAPVYEELGITTVRLPLEKTHLSSYVGSQLLMREIKKYPRLIPRAYGYPQPRHFESAQQFLSATRNGTWPVLVHPAAFDDFAGNPYGDPLCEDRVRQYEKLREWFL